MAATIIDGKFLALETKEKLKDLIEKETIKPKLAVILVGDDEASRIYVSNKQKAAAEVGIECNVLKFDNISEKDLAELVEQLNDDPSVNGILVQLPLPRHINSDIIIKLINPLKDVDGFSPCNLGLLQMGSKDAIVAATPKGVFKMLKTVCSDLDGKNAVIVGRSNIVGKPLASLLLNNDCTVSLTHSHTKNIKDLTSKADILVAACGVPKLVKKDWVKKGAIVIDVGISKVDGKIVGDVDFEEVSEIASYISKVPGGVGPMTVAMLLDNTYEAFKRR